jgi:serine protease AprX
MRRTAQWTALLAASLCAGSAFAARVDEALWPAARDGRVPVLVRLADPPPARPPVRGDFVARVTATVEALQAAAAQRQRDLRAALRARGTAHRAFWIANVVALEADAPTLRWLAARPDVAAIEDDRPVRSAFPLARAAPKAQTAVEWGVARVNAPQVWALGHIGQGVVVGAQDSGYAWQHPALRNAYRGWNGVAGQHDHNWHDAIHSGPVNACGYSSAEPCDDSGHGSHTLGSAVGDDGGTNQIGVAPGARWIGCRNMNQGNGTPSTYLECFQWFLAPTTVAGGNPQPALAPHVINNSWLCTAGEGCTQPGALDEAVENTHAAGILVVVSAGNAGPGCATIFEPPSIHPLSLTVGATTITDAIASFSSRGPVTIDGSNRLKPDLAAPGASIRSSLPPAGYGVMSGTSMAAPHVVGIAALMMSANPALRGDPDRVSELLRATAIGTTATQDCGTYPGAEIPNAVFGRGRVDALAAVQAALALSLFRDGFE